MQLLDERSITHICQDVHPATRLPLDGLSPTKLDQHIILPPPDATVFLTSHPTTFHPTHSFTEDLFALLQQLSALF
jgi:hypothetical protein